MEEIRSSESSNPTECSPRAVRRRLNACLILGVYWPLRDADRIDAEPIILPEQAESCLRHGAPTAGSALRTGCASTKIATTTKNAAGHPRRRRRLICTLGAVKVRGCTSRRLSRSSDSHRPISRGCGRCAGTPLCRRARPTSPCRSGTGRRRRPARRGNATAACRWRPG